jgi:energy-converting hydrogenase Eha subunit H
VQKRSGLVIIIFSFVLILADIFLLYDGNIAYIEDLFDTEYNYGIIAYISVLSFLVGAGLLLEYIQKILLWIKTGKAS